MTIISPIINLLRPTLYYYCTVHCCSFRMIRVCTALELLTCTPAARTRDAHMLPLYDALLVTHNSRSYPMTLSYYTTVQYCCDNCLEGRRKSSAQANTADDDRLLLLCMIRVVPGIVFFCSGHVVPSLVVCFGISYMYASCPLKLFQFASSAKRRQYSTLSANRVQVVRSTYCTSNT